MYVFVIVRGKEALNYGKRWKNSRATKYANPKPATYRGTIEDNNNGEAILFPGEDD
jgi:hypothetical protein